MSRDLRPKFNEILNPSVYGASQGIRKEKTNSFTGKGVKVMDAHHGRGESKVTASRRGKQTSSGNPGAASKYPCAWKNEPRAWSPEKPWPPGMPPATETVTWDSCLGK